jgi:hypothetical protein
LPNAPRTSCAFGSPSGSIATTLSAAATLL